MTLSSLKNRILTNKFLIPAWLAFHVAILLVLVAFMLGGREFSIDADLFHMLPASTLGEAMGKADEKLSDTTAKNVFVLVGHEDFSRAKETAAFVYDHLKDDDNFTSLSLYAGASAIGEIEECVAPFRYQLLDDEAISLLSEEGGALRSSKRVFGRTPIPPRFCIFGLL